MPTVGEEIERRRERKEEEEQIKEQELAYQARLQQAQALEQQRQQQARQSRLKALAKQVARKEIKKVVKRRVAAWAARGIASALAAAAPYILPVLAVIAGIALVIFIIIATIAVLCNPQGLGQNLAAVGAKFSGIISSETCQAFSGLGGGIASTIEKGQELFCSNKQVLAQQHNTSYPRQNDPDLARLMVCIAGREPSLTGTAFTFDNSADVCNYTRADTDHVCTRCSHAEYSCHYGGRTGNTGALAVDYPVTGVAGVRILQAAIACSQSTGIPLKRATCEANVPATSSGDNAVACSDSRATHVHISIGKCDKDNGPINSR